MDKLLFELISDSWNKDIIIKSIIYGAEKRLIEIQSNSLEHLRDRTQSDYDRYIFAKSNKCFFKKDKKREICKHNIELCEKFEITNYKLLNRRLRIDKEILYYKMLLAKLKSIRQ